MIVLVHENHDKMVKCYTNTVFLQWFRPCKSCKFCPWFQILTKIDEIRLNNVYFFFKYEHFKCSV